MPNFWSVKVSSRILTSFIVIGINLLIFIGLTSFPAYRAHHHHWIFPILSSVYFLEWAITVLLERFNKTFPLFDLRVARLTILSIMSFLLLMGLVRHQTVLTCFDRCGYKLAATALIGGFIFFAQGWRDEKGFWNVVRSQIAGLGSWVWAGYLFFQFSLLATWIIDLILISAGLLLWLGRRCKARFSVALAIPAFLLIRQTGNEWAIIFLSFLLIGLVFFMSKNWAEPLFNIKKRNVSQNQKKRSGAYRFGKSLLKITVTVGGFVFMIRILAGPVFQNLDPHERSKILSEVASFKKASGNPDNLSPLAKRLRDHVFVLSEQIGERAIYQRERLKNSQNYLIQYFQSLGFHPWRQDFKVQESLFVTDGKEFSNLGIVLGNTKSSKPIWVVGAHYDSAPGTPGADDNASGVAVLLELARLLKNETLAREIRLVAFANEEPPSFGTQNMGSFHYAKKLKDQNISLKAMISLEMLGYFNDHPKSQLYPPFLHLFYPDKGNFVALVSNFKSRKVLKEVRKKWRSTSSFPLETVILPGPLSAVALSDQLNFWGLGFPALMISDTSFYRNPHYHQETDTLDTLDFERMAIITESLVEVLKQ